MRCAIRGVDVQDLKATPIALEEQCEGQVGYLITTLPLPKYNCGKASERLYAPLQSNIPKIGYQASATEGNNPPELPMYPLCRLRYT